MNIESLLAQAQEASFSLARLDEEAINRVLLTLADAIEQEHEGILQANARDMERMPSDNPKRDRLLLTPERLRGIAADMRGVAALPSPLGKVLEHTVRPNGMQLTRISVPFGVVAVVYEARPNVTFDVFSLCLKSGNACVLKGGSDAEESNKAIVQLLHRVLGELDVHPHTVTLLPTDHESTAALLHANDYIDLLIPRGGSGLIRFVRQNATVPVIETGAGVCHTYFDAEGDLSKGAAIVCNAKTRRVSVCNALDCLLVHRSRLADLPSLCSGLSRHDVLIYADAEALSCLTDGGYPTSLLAPADAHTFGTEFLDYKMAVRTVGSLDEALLHIRRYGSHHSECIITENEETSRAFARSVDAACVYTNVSTAFTDGAQFGLGAEIGISTQKMHARGPMGLAALTTYKWLIQGDGQIRTS